MQKLIKDVLIKKIKETNLSNRKICELAEISEMTLYNIKNGKTSPERKVVENLSEVLNCTKSELYTTYKSVVISGISFVRGSGLSTLISLIGQATAKRGLKTLIVSEVAIPLNYCRFNDSSRKKFYQKMRKNLYFAGIYDLAIKFPYLNIWNYLDADFFKSLADHNRYNEITKGSMRFFQRDRISYEQDFRKYVDSILDKFDLILFDLSCANESIIPTILELSDCFVSTVNERILYETNIPVYREFINMLISDIFAKSETPPFHIFSISNANSRNMTRIKENILHSFPSNCSVNFYQTFKLKKRPSFLDLDGYQNLTSNTALKHHIDKFVDSIEEVTKELD